MLISFDGIGVYSPILLARAARHKIVHYAFLVAKQFGVGVIISTAFIHVSSFSSHHELTNYHLQYLYDSQILKGVYLALHACQPHVPKRMPWRARV